MQERMIVAVDSDGSDGVVQILGMVVVTEANTGWLY